MTSSVTHIATRLARTAAIAGICTLAASAARAQGAPVVLLLDKQAVAPNQAPNGFTDTSVNATIAAVGVRDFLPAFTAHVGQHLTLPAGQIGVEGWFALTSTPSSWASESGADDGLQNFVMASAGLGSPDVNGNRQTWLGAVPGVQPLRADGLQMLLGQSVCAVVYANEIPWTQTSTSLSGPNLGLMAFAVSALVGGDGATLPSVDIQILEPTTCSGSLALFANAPAVE